MRDEHFGDYCKLVKHFKDQGRSLADAQNLAENIVYGERPKVPKDAKSQEKGLGAFGGNGTLPQAKYLPEIKVSTPQAARLPAAYEGTQAKTATVARVQGPFHARITTRNPGPSQAAYRPEANAGSQVKFPKSAGGLAKSRVSKPTKIPGLFLIKAKSAVEPVFSPRDPTQARKPIKIEGPIKAEALPETTPLLESVGHSEAVDRKDFAVPSYPKAPPSFGGR